MDGALENVVRQCYNFNAAEPFELLLITTMEAKFCCQLS